MKLTEIFQRNKYSLSFEVFPPKTDDSYDSVKTAMEEIAKLSPAFMSVTYGAGGGTSKYTLDIAKNIREEFGVPSLAHLTCVSSTKETVAARIADFQAAGIKNVMALRGDIPADMQGQDRSKWAYSHAVELVRELKEKGDFCVGGACYPEVHPESASQKEDVPEVPELPENQEELGGIPEDPEMPEIPENDPVEGDFDEDNASESSAPSEDMIQNPASLENAAAAVASGSKELTDTNDTTEDSDAIVTETTEVDTEQQLKGGGDMI